MYRELVVRFKFNTKPVEKKREWTAGFYVVWSVLLRRAFNPRLTWNCSALRTFWKWLWRLISCN